MAKKRATKTEAPKTTAQQLGSLIKSARDIMRKDRGLNGDLDRLPMLTWVMFLKFLDDVEQNEEVESKLAGKEVPHQPSKPPTAGGTGRRRRTASPATNSSSSSTTTRRFVPMARRGRGCSPTFGPCKGATAMDAGT